MWSNYTKHKNVAEKHLKHLKQIKPYFWFTYMSWYIQVKVLNMASVMHFLTGDKSCCQLWQLLKAMVSWVWYKSKLLSVMKIWWNEALHFSQNSSELRFKVVRSGLHFLLLQFQSEVGVALKRRWKRTSTLTVSSDCESESELYLPIE